MSWTTGDIIAAICGAVSLAASAASLAWKAAINQLRTDLSDFRAHLADARTSDQKELRDWINGSFMRATVVESRIDILRQQLVHVVSEMGRVSGEIGRVDARLHALEHRVSSELEKAA